MSEASARLRLPFILPGQAQKELFHNEALSAVDALLHPAVEALEATSPPTSPEIGQSWVIGSDPSGAWSGHAHALAIWTEGGWRFHAPAAGMGVTVRPTRMPASWDGTRWRQGEVHCARLFVNGTPVLGPRAAAIPDPAGGSTVDAEARATLAALLAALRVHGLLG